MTHSPLLPLPSFAGQGRGEGRHPHKRPAIILLALLALSACASYPQFVMLNPRTGATVECQQPDMTASTADFLKSRACLSACEAHGFRPVPGMPAPPGGADIPDQCSN